jgi:hypothetical protein
MTLELIETKIKMANHVFVLSFLAFACAMAFAFDPSPVQDFCIADLTGSGCGPTITFLALFCNIDFSYCLYPIQNAYFIFFFGIRIFNKFTQLFKTSEVTHCD